MRSQKTNEPRRRGRSRAWAGALAVVSGTILFGACIHAPLEPVDVSESTARVGRVDFLEDVKPILDQRCVTCHSCYNAPCQALLSSYEGIDRGGSKARVYSSTRLRVQQPTRLGFDATTTEGWRELGFFSLTENDAAPGSNDSIMMQLLAAKRREPVSEGNFFPNATDLTCAATRGELGNFLARHPQRGMPFGFPALTDREYDVLASWLAAGAPGPSAEEQARLTTPSKAVARRIREWETFLNQDDPKHAMTARYIYEHFFLARLSFSDANAMEFYQLERSETPPGEPIRPIATVRPYDPPAVDRFYYRFRRLHATPVYKTHMVVDIDDTSLARVRDLFIGTEWLEQPELQPLGDETGANPFRIYAQIPPVVRYQFLLDHAEYFIRTFIRGPVCDGQVALNVIHDHFWVLFLDPSADETIQNPEFLTEQAGNLRLPTEQGSQDLLIRTFSDSYRRRYAEFYRAKSDLYERLRPEGLGLEAIWPGRRAKDAPLLTVYRHFNSASVHKGALGDLPRTLWVIDYSQFERIYYALVAGFDVFGNLSHQVNVRRYMDYLRMEGELNFLSFLPPDVRFPMLQSWYLGDEALKDVGYDEVFTRQGTLVEFETDDPKRELVEQVVKKRLLKSTKIGFDEVNYHADGEEPPMPERFDTREDIMNGFRALTAPGTGFIKRNNEFGINLLLVRVREGKKNHVFTIVVNRWHDNVNSMFGEEKRLDPSKDTIDFIEGSVGSYPNYFFDLELADVPDFFDMLENYDDSPEYAAKIHRYGVNRSDPHFWEVFDWFQAWLDRRDPVRAGLYDLSRYYHEATPPAQR